MSRTAALLALLLLPLSALAQRDAKVPDPDPELERKTFIVAPGFEVNLFAADPLLAQPIQMDFDPPGRLPVANADPDELRPAGPPVGGDLGDLSADQAGREGQRQDHHSGRHQGG